jgi:hypothetical protein
MHHLQHHQIMIALLYHIMMGMVHYTNKNNVRFIPTIILGITKCAVYTKYCNDSFIGFSTLLTMQNYISVRQPTPSSVGKCWKTVS